MNSMERLHEMTMNREMAARADAVNVTERTAELTFSSETPYERWFGPEILDHSPGAVDLSRLEEIGVVLFNHDVNRPIGRVERAWIGDDARGHAEIRFDTDDEANKIFQKVKNGFLRGVSVGYKIREFLQLKENEVSADGRFQGPAVVITKWEPLEISIVSVPADAGVGVGRSIEDHCKKERKMDNEETLVMDEAQRQQIAEAVEAERRRAEKSGRYHGTLPFF